MNGNSSVAAVGLTTGEGRSVASAATATRAELWDLLGGVRFLLALVVVATHIQWFKGSCWLTRSLLPLGFFPAVLCFLVISGFSIGHSITQRRAGFLGRRFRRIYPLYALAVIASLVPDVLTGGTPTVGVGQWVHTQWFHTLVGNLFFTQTFHYGPVGNNPVMWSLAVEAAFYLLAPLLTRMTTGQLVGLAAVSAVAFVAFPRTGLAYYAWLRHGLPMLFLGWAWLAGFIYYRLRADGRAGVVLIVSVVALTSLNRTFMTDRSVLLEVLSLSVLVFGGGATLPAAVRRLLKGCGDLSYPLYLFHAPLLLTYAHYFGGQSQWLLLAMALPLSAAMLAVDAALRRPVARACDAAAAAVDAGRQSAAAVASALAAGATAVATTVGGRLATLRALAGGLPRPAVNISLAAVAGLISVIATLARR